MLQLLVYDGVLFAAFPTGGGAVNRVVQLWEGTVGILAVMLIVDPVQLPEPMGCEGIMFPDEFDQVMTGLKLALA